MSTKRPTSLTKSRTLGLWSLALLATYVAAAQPWFSLEMAPSGGPVELGSYNGFTAFAFLSPLLLVCLAAIFASAFLGTIGRKVAGGLAAVASAISLALLTPRIIAADVSGLAPQIEKLTGIAATHGIDDLTVLTLSWAWITIACLGLLLMVAAAFLINERNWPKKLAKSDRYQTGQTAKDDDDTIGLWDSQR